MSRCIARLVAHAPDRLLWATNWPHPGQVGPPSNEELRVLRESWLPSAAVREQVLTTNATLLYDF